jgi:hypothetical protein
MVRRVSSVLGAGATETSGLPLEINRVQQLRTTSQYHPNSRHAKESRSNRDFLSPPPVPDGGYEPQGIAPATLSIRDGEPSPRGLATWVEDCAFPVQMPVQRRLVTWAMRMRRRGPRLQLEDFQGAVLGELTCVCQNSGS